MLKPFGLLVTLSVSLSACAATSASGAASQAPTSASPSPAAVPTREPAEAEKKLAEAYRLLSTYRHTEARKLIDDAIKTYRGQRDLEGLATAYTVSADYYRYVGNDQYKQNLARHRTDPSGTPPLPLHVVLLGSIDRKTEQQSRRAEDLHEKAIRAALAAGDHFKASSSYYRLAVLYMRNKRATDACDALDATLAQHSLGQKTYPDHPVRWNSARYPSYADQIVDTKKNTGCDDLQKKP